MVYAVLTLKEILDFLFFIVFYEISYTDVFFFLKKEHMAIRDGKVAADAIDWNDYRSMNFTRAVSNRASHLLLLLSRNIHARYVCIFMYSESSSD